MKSKIRKIKHINDTTVCTLHIPKEIIELCHYGEIIEILNKFNEANKVEKQVEIVRSLSAYMNIDTAEIIQSVISILSYLFLRSKSKNPIKRSILRIFANASNVSSEIVNELSKQLLDIIKSINSDTDYNEINDFVNSVNDCFDNCPPAATAVAGILEKILEFLINSFDLLTEKLEKPCLELFQIIHNITKALVSVFQKINIESSLRYIFPKILKCSSKSLNDLNVSFDTKNNCGIILAVAAKHSSASGDIDLLRSCIEVNLQKWDIKADSGTTDLITTCILSGILNAFNSDTLCEYNEMLGKSMLFMICQKLYDLSKSSVKSTDIIISINRTLLLVSRSLDTLSEQELEGVLTLLLDHIWIDLEHYIDTVRHIAKSILVNVAKLSAARRRIGNEQPLNQTLNGVFATSVLSNTRYIGMSVIANEIGFTVLLEKKPDLVTELLEKSQESSISIYVVTCCENLMKYHLKEVSEESWINTWIIPLSDKLTNYDEYQEKQYCYQELFTVAIKLKPAILNKILSQWSTKDEMHLISLLNCVVIARRIGAGITSKSKNNKWRNLIDFSVLESAMYHPNDEIRITSLTLVAESLKSTELFNKEELSFIMKFLHYNINTQLPATRQQILSLMRKILLRFNEGYYAIVRDVIKLEKARGDNTKIAVLKEHKCEYENFIFSLRGFIFDNIFPGANVSRRVISLEILILMESIVAEISERINLSVKDLWRVSDVETLMMCLSDSYESNKKLATKLLATCPIELSILNDSNETKSFIKNALDLAASVRPTETITAAYMLETSGYSPLVQKVLFDFLTLSYREEYSSEYLMIKLLLNQLQNQVQIAKKSLWKAAESAPMQGTLFCIRHLMEKYIKICKSDEHWKTIIADLIETCLTVIAIVGVVVNNASPEGHLPNYEETFEKDKLINDEEGNSVTPQMLLVCCWRSVKEVSLLLGDLSLNAPLETINQPGIISEQQLLVVGQHFTRLLTEIKHRGAFEQAYVGFSKLCTCLWNSEVESLHCLPEVWLKDILDAVAGKDNSLKSKLCITRRSAGLPFMVQAIVTTELQTGQTKNFHLCMQTLLECAKSEDDNVEMRTHAKNILRTLYRHAQLGEMVTPYLTDGMKIAILSFKKKAFAERNSATLLFASLMTRIFGVQRLQDIENINIRNRMIARVFFMRHPTLHAFLLEEIRTLTRSTNTCSETALLPVLMILNRLYAASPEDEESNTQLQSFVPYVRQCCGLESFMIRKKSAIVLSEIMPARQRFGFLNELFTEIIENKIDSDNYLHGLLLQISYFLKSRKDLEENSAIVRNIFNMRHVTCCLNFRRCALTAALYMQISLNFLSNYDSKEFDSSDLKSLLNIIATQEKYVEENDRIGKSIYQSTATHLQLCILHILHRQDVSSISNILFEILKHSSVDVQLFTLNVVMYLYNDKANAVLLEMWEIPDTVKLFVESLASDYRQRLIAYLNNNWMELITFDIYFAIDDDLTSRAFAMLSNFPKAVLELAKRFSADVFNYYVKKSELNDENMLYACVSCIRSLFIALHNQDLRDYNIKNVCNILYECSFTSNDAGCRYCVALILTENHWLLTGTTDVVDGDDLCTLWCAVMQLLEDPEPQVRSRISRLTLKLSNNSSLAIAEKSREELLPLCVNYIKNISRDKCVALLFYWALIDRTHTSDNEDIDGPVYEQGEVNTYVEGICLSKLSAKMLSHFFHCESTTDINRTFEEVTNLIRDNETYWTQNNHHITTFLNVLEEIKYKINEPDNDLKQILKNYFRNKNKISNEKIFYYKIFSVINSLLHSIL